MQRLKTEQATMPRDNVETASLTYCRYKDLSRRQQLEPLLEKIVRDASGEEVSALRGYLEWMVAQVKNRAKVRSAA